MSAEATGVAFLIMSILAPGIFAENLNPKNGSLTLFAVAFAVFGTLSTLIIIFGPISGAHFNPLVTIRVWLQKHITAGEAAGYIAAQLVGGFIGVLLTHAMFGLPLLEISASARNQPGLWVGEFVATFGLFAMIEGCRVARYAQGGWVIGAYIFAAIWFTSSTCFANPAVTISRMFTATITGIQPADGPMFMVGQVLGAASAVGLFTWLESGMKKE